jgi:hypothetical protein
MKFEIYKKKFDSFMIVVLCLIPLVIFFKINTDNRVMINLHRQHSMKYFIIKAMVTILMLTFIMYLKDFILN